MKDLRKNFNFIANKKKHKCMLSKLFVVPRFYRKIRTNEHLIRSVAYDSVYNIFSEMRIIKLSYFKTRVWCVH